MRYVDNSPLDQVPLEYAVRFAVLHRLDPLLQDVAMCVRQLAELGPVEREWQPVAEIVARQRLTPEIIDE